MTRLARNLLAVGFLSAATLFLAADAAQAASPALRASITPYPANFAPNTPYDSPNGLPEYILSVLNVGSAATSSPFTAIVTLPPGVTEDGTGLQTVTLTHDDFSFPGEGTPLSPIATDLLPGENVTAKIPVDVGALPDGQLSAGVEVTGGGAPAVHASGTTTIASADAAFGFLPGPGGLAGGASDESGSPVTQAGAHPYQLTLDLTFPSHPTHSGGGGKAVLAGAEGGVRDLGLTLPRGFILDPNATPVRCTEAQLETRNPDGSNACPDASAVGIVGAKTTPLGDSFVTAAQSPLYNMVPPAGAPAELGFDAAAAGIYTHILGGVRAGDYALASDTPDIISKVGNQIYGAEVELWGDPADPAHDTKRGGCVFTNSGSNGHSRDGGHPQTCPVAPTDHALLTMPTACRGSLVVDASADSWQNPGVFHDRSAQLTDPNGDPTPVSGCSALDFTPSIDLQPTTPEADSSSGMDVDLQIPQTEDLNTLAEANLKKAVVTLPEGMALNPSASDGLQGCSEAQIGLTQESPVPQFNNADPSCPNGSKVGDGSIDTPLLPDPLAVDLYLADPDDNPFHSLLSGYLVAHGSGVTIKLAALFDRDPQTGRITATVDNNPQLPFSDLHLHFKGGDRGVIVTPPECGTYTISSDLIPWSAQDPNNPQPSEIVHRSNTFQVTTGPGGGPCPDLTDPARFTPGFSAGTASPAAGQYSPFVLRVSRPDGQQSLKQIHLDLPPGLVAKLNGVPRCSQSDITPGIDGHTSCPADSQIGVVNVGAGAGPTPFFLTDQPVYLTDGYAGAPYGLVIDTHAAAGPFDLGHVVIRSTLNVDKDDAQVHVDSEPLPWIIQGIPLHIRSVSVLVDRPGFILNPTNCNPMQVTGTVTGGGEDFDAPGDDTVKPVSDRFQVGGCGGLGFSPRLTGTILNGTQGIHRSDHPNLN
ncbi:MAG: hypothetical protein J2O47_02480, partial [Acidimicrobiaceae bacterium]|nr:hypothetical protein [Acidimicrobiaceae bacterium]